MLVLTRAGPNRTATGKLVYLDLFERYDLEEDQSSRLTYAQLAEEFHVSPSNVTNYLAAARREFRQCVLDQVREMTTNEEEYQAEARALLGTGTKWGGSQIRSSINSVL
jgi:hypothetical protein